MNHIIIVKSMVGDIKLSKIANKYGASMVMLIVGGFLLIYSKCAQESILVLLGAILIITGIGIIIYCVYSENKRENQRIQYR